LRRTLGATAIFVGWLCLPLSALSGLVAFHDMGAENTQEFLAPPTVFGFAGDLLMWLIAAAALLALVPAFVAVFSRDPSRPLYVAGTVVGGLGMVLLIDNLGRAYGALLVLSGASFATGGWLIEGAQSQAVPWEVAAVWAYLEGRREAKSARALASGPTVALGVDEDLAPAYELGPDPLPEPQLEAQPEAPAPRAAEQAAEPPATQRVQLDAVRHATPTAAVVESPGTSPGSFGRTICTWCSADIPADATTCPECQATLDPVPAIDGSAISGLTQVSPELLAYSAEIQKKRKRKSLLRRVLGMDASVKPSESVPVSVDGSSEGALRPPTPEVRAEMVRIDLEIAGLAPWMEPASHAPETTAEVEAGPVPAAELEPGAEVEPSPEPPPTEAGPAAEEPAAETATRAPARARRTRRPKA
jgi:hypothetical protein